MQPLDADARKRALQPDQSFIIQAPAGSGKTETLTQRYLNLLAHAQQAPEEIIALTFTNKAANEMHHRIYQALVDANTGVEPPEAHKKTTFNLAKKALKNSLDHAWGLLQNPKRLRITTIDAFCQFLAQKLVYESDDALTANVTENPELLYEKVVEQLIADTTDKSPWQLSLYNILMHLDNDIERLKSLLAELLAKREQWLPIVFQMHHNLNDTKQEKIESGFQTIFIELIEQTREALQFHNHEKKLTEILQFCHPDLSQQDFVFSTGNPLAWQLLIKLLFSKENTFRKTFTAKQHLPAKDPIAKQHANWLIGYIEKISDNNKEKITDLISELRLFSQLSFTQQEWAILQAITQTALSAVQYLKLIFSQTGQVDFNEVSLQALSALGNEENPTNLALYLDHQIQHLLIDEFQDTSILQYGIIKMLTLEWRPNDGKTLFIVGDPMQSIYRFRQAEVSLFLQVRDYGLNLLNPIFLQLNCNFRSTYPVVDWINRHFCAIFPQKDDINFGGISYSSATTLTKPTDDSAVTSLYFTTQAAEATHIAQTISDYQQTNPAHSIAILVRSRNHLKEIVPALHKAEINIVENEIEKLFHQPIIADLLSLACILSNPSHTIYWISLLQSKLFGFTLNELNCLQNTETEDDEHHFLARLIAFCKTHNQEAPQQKALILARWLTEPNFAHTRSTLPKRLSIIWQKLDGDLIYPHPTVYDNFMTLLMKNLTTDQTLIQNTHRLIDVLKKTYASAASTAKVQLMTIHKSKGLEFDFVIIPQLDKSGMPDSSTLFLHENMQLSDGHSHLLMSPIKHSWETKKPPLYCVIQNIQKKRSIYERQRLLYVATTRARSKILLSALTKETSLDTARKKKPVQASLLALLHPLNLDWGLIADNEANKTKGDLIRFDTIITRIKNYYTSAPITLQPTQVELIFEESNTMENKPNHVIFSDVVLSDDRRIGSALHAIFNYICLQGIENWQNYFEVATFDYALSGTLKAKAYTYAEQAINHTLTNYAWIFLSEGASEQLMLSLSYGVTQKHIADRIIFKNGTYHIIDYKFAVPTGENTLEMFLNEQQQIYQKQLLTYQKLLAMHAGTDKKNIHIYLYFPLIPYLHLLPNL